MDNIISSDSKLVKIPYDQWVKTTIQSVDLLLRNVCVGTDLL